MIAAKLILKDIENLPAKERRSIQNWLRCLADDLGNLENEYAKKFTATYEV